MPGERIYGFLGFVVLGVFISLGIIVSPVMQKIGVFALLLWVLVLGVHMIRNR